MARSRASIFRANEAAAEGRDEAIHSYSRWFKLAKEREAVAAFVDTLIEEYGPVVDGYPSWHPFVTDVRASDSLKAVPDTRPQGFAGLDHTIHFRDAFITAPYGEAEIVVKSVDERNDGYTEAEEITDVRLYHEKATPVLVKCVGIPKEEDGTISKRFALGRMLSESLPHWEDAQCGETWSTMRRYILGTPCGSRSSLFVNQETGKALREVHELLNRHELFGPVYAG